MRFRTVLPALALGVLVAVPAQAQSSFQITLENLTTPGPNNGQPFSPSVFVTHDGSLNLWTVGEAASNPLRQIAEEGDNTPLLADLNTQLGGGVFQIATPGATPLLPGQSVTFTIQADTAHPFLSTAWMLGRTNDGFSGLVGLNLLSLPNGVTTFNLGGIDAGTEVNNESAAFLPALGGIFNDPEGGVVTAPHPGILGIADAPLSWGWTGPVARLSIVPASASPEPGVLAFVVTGGLLAGMLRLRRFRVTR